VSTTEQIIAKGDVDTPREILASRLIDAWCDSHGGRISWVKAIQITAIVTKMSDEERARMLALGDDGCEMGIVQRLRNGGQPELANMAELLVLGLRELLEKAGLSDDMQYGTLSTSYVRDVCRKALTDAKELA
jgi:hypothetical protein